MHTTIDAAGRLVIPKALRLDIGLEAGAVEILVEGDGLRIRPIASDHLEEQDGFLVVPSDQPLNSETVRDLRLADQR